MNQQRGADAVIETLRGAGVKHLFSLSGNQIMPIYDACLNSGIELLHVRHEAAAVHMADAVGRLGDEVGIALLTAGPGHANALSAMYSARMSESPVLVLSGHAPVTRLGQGAFQEMAQAELAGHVCKAASLVTDVRSLRAEIELALTTAASGRPGPVHLSLPFDVLQATIDDDPANHLETDFDGRRRRAPRGLDAESMETLTRLAEDARRPIALVGPALTDRCAGRASDLPWFGMQSPRGLNDPAAGGLKEVLPEADLIVLIGKRMDFTLGFGQGPEVGDLARIVQIDWDTDVLAQGERNAREGGRDFTAIHADPGLAWTAFETVVARADQVDPDWRRRLAGAIGHRPDFSTRFGAAPADGSPAGSLHPAEVLARLDEALRGQSDTIFVSDGGEFGQWAQACVTGDRRIINGPSGAIGGGLSYALGAQAAHPEATVVVAMGDGTAGFHLSELDTAVRYELPVVCLIGNDAAWNAELQIQRRDYGEDRTFGCELLAQRYDLVARALGAEGHLVTEPDELAPAFQTALSMRRPTVVNAMIRREPAPDLRLAQKT